MDAAVGNKAGSAALGTEGAVFAGAAIYAALTQLTLGFIMFCSVHTYTHIYKGYTNAASAASVPRFYWLFFAVGGASSVGFGLRGSLSARPLKPRRPGPGSTQRCRGPLLSRAAGRARRSPPVLALALLQASGFDNRNPGRLAVDLGYNLPAGLQAVTMQFLANHQAGFVNDHGIGIDADAGIVCRVADRQGAVFPFFHFSAEYYRGHDFSHGVQAHIGLGRLPSGPLGNGPFAA